MPATASSLSARRTDVATASSTVRQIADFMSGASFETTRPTTSDIATLHRVATAGTRVYLTALPNRPPIEMIEQAARLRAAGFEPIPHLAARGLASTGMLEDIVSRLAAETGVRRLLVVAGDHDRAAGPFASAVEVIESGLLQRHGIVEVGIGGYPDGHPRLSAQTLDQALVVKVEAAEQTGLAVHIVSQFAFDAATMLRWLTRLRDLGIEHPVRVGMAGPTNLATLLRYAKRCGVRASAQGITRNAGLIKHLVGTSAPDGIIRPLIAACRNGRLGQVTPHFYSFGGLAATGRWASAAADGHIVLDRTDGFGVVAP